MDKPVIYTVDIETRPSEVYAWSMYGEQNVGVNQLIRAGGVLMFAAKQYGKTGIESHCEWDGYEAMIARAHEIYDAADYVISYNGVSFDSKHLRAAWALAGMAPPSPWREIDLLKTARKMNLPFRKLQYVTAAFGLEHKGDSGGFETWNQILRPDSEAQQLAAQRKMIRYCKQDVKITEQLFNRFLPWIDGLNIPIYTDTDSPFLCTRCPEPEEGTVHRRGWAYTTTYRYRRYQCTKCGGWMKEKSSERLPSVLRNA